MQSLSRSEEKGCSVTMKALLLFCVLCVPAALLADQIPPGDYYTEAVSPNGSISYALVGPGADAYTGFFSSGEAQSFMDAAADGAVSHWELDYCTGPLFCGAPQIVLMVDPLIVPVPVPVARTAESGTVWLMVGGLALLGLCRCLPAVRNDGSQP